MNEFERRIEASAGGGLRSEGIETLQVNNMEDPEEGWAYMDTKDIVGCILEILSFKRYQ